MTETYVGVVDRVVDGETAVLLLEDEDEVVDQLDVPVERLPEAARTEGVAVRVVTDAGELVECEVRSAETERRRKSAQDRLDRLSDRL